MKRFIPFVLVFTLGFAVAALWVARQQSARNARSLAEQQAAWEAEKAELESALASRVGRANRSDRKSVV